LIRAGDYFPKIADFGLARSDMREGMAMTVAGTAPYMAPETADARVPYEFPADVWSLGLVFASLLDPEWCCRWGLPLIPERDREALRKRWPSGAQHSCSPQIQALQKEMISSIPGHRPTMVTLISRLKQLQADLPLPHPLWESPTLEPEGPPPLKAVTAQTAAEIAGKCGYGAGVFVMVKANNSWHRGVIKQVSTRLCPGAVQVHYKERGGPEQAILVCPWQFTEYLRPDSPLGERSPTSCTMVFPESTKDTPYLRDVEVSFLPEAPASPTPVVPIARTQCERCTVQ